ncbi:hypothetical protein HJFPF1_09479 [Paramyrothecium foliicola]|nr:hypothetical protein HJFPF1_09479 [Paramyrothecium foliicola]
MEYSWISDCPNDCAEAGETSCPDLQIGCMCKDEQYVLAGLCCVRKTCGAVGFALGQRYVEDYCQRFQVKPPRMDNLRCATLGLTTETASSTSSTATSAPTSSNAASNEVDHSGSPNIATIAGIAGGIVALLLILAAVYMFGWRKRKAAKAAQRPGHSSPPAKESTLEVVKMSELDPGSSSSSSETQYDYNGHPGYGWADSTAQMGMGYSPLGNSYSAELGIQGARPHGSELSGRPLLPPRPELQGMSFATKPQGPAELYANSGYYRTSYQHNA